MPRHCPVECETGEILCEGPTQCNGCIDANTCRPEATNVNGEACDPSSASHECPIHCCEHEYLCPGIEDKVGCKTEDLCLEKTKDKDDEYCGIESVCSPCKIDDVSCPQGWFDNGCEKPPHCIWFSPHSIGQCTVQGGAGGVIHSGGFSHPLSNHP